MTGRDRIVIMVIVVAVVLAGVWMEVVSPERKQVGELNSQVASAQSQLTAAEGKVADAKGAQSQYATAYAATVNLGKAVPPSQEVASLIDQLTQASNQRDVYFSSIANGTSGAGSSATAAGAAATAVGLTQLPFTFTFEGSYFDLEHLFNRLTGFTKLDGSGNIEVSGRLLTIRSVSLTPASSSTTSGTGKTSELTGAITAAAYVLPASQSLTGSATPASPTGTGTSAVPTSTSSPVSPAIVKVNP